MVLNTYGSNTAVITNGAGKVEYPTLDFMFLYGEGTEAHKSCSMTWRGRFFIFGGETEKNQISVLNGCKLERIGDLQFEHYYGACSNVNDQVYLCFNVGSSSDLKKCRVASSPTGNYSEIAESNVNHGKGNVGSSDGKSTIFGLY